MDDDQICTDVHDAIATALLGHEKAMLGPWVLVAATTTIEGGRGVWLLTATDTIDYEAKGLLTDALDRVREDGLNAVAWTQDEDEA